MATTTSIKVILTKAGTEYSATQQYRLLDYIVVDDTTMYVCRRVDPTTMTCVGHPLTDSDYWDKCVDLSEAQAKAVQAAQNAQTAADTANATNTSVTEAETKRVTAETARADAETERKNAEQARQSAESARATAEQSRQTAETQRETDSATAVSAANTAAAAATEAAGKIETTVADVARLNDSIGVYSDRESITLTPSQTGVAISADGVMVSKAGWAIAEFTAQLGNEYLFKPGETSADVCVFAEKVDKVETRAIDYAYTYGSDGKVTQAVATYNGKTYTYTYTYGTDGTTIITDQTGATVDYLPSVYTTTVGAFQPMTRLNADAELPKDGYCRFVSNFQASSAIQIVVSYKVGSADLTMKVVRDGMTASMCTQLSKINQKLDNLSSEVNPTGLTVKVMASADAKIYNDGKEIAIPGKKKVTLTGLNVFRTLKSPVWGPSDDEKANAAQICHLSLSGVLHTGVDFGFATNLKTLYLDRVDVSNMNSLYGMFFHCESLTAVDVSGWDISNVSDFTNLFYSCYSLTTLDVSGWDTSNVRDFCNTFNQNRSLKTVDVSGWDTSNGTSFRAVFRGCSSLTSVDVSGWDTSKVTYMDNMFLGCSSLTALDVSGWDTSKVTNMGNMFLGCSSLTALDVSGWDTSKVTNMGNMFLGCSSLTNILFGEGFGKAEASGLTLDLSSCGSAKNYQLTDATYTSLLTLYDRAAAGLPTMTIAFHAKHTLPDGFKEALTAKGYVITQ